MNKSSNDGRRPARANAQKLAVLLVAVLWVCGARGQQGGALTDNDYAHAETLLNYGTEPFIDHNFSRPNWLPGDRFWYRVLTAKGSEFILVNPARGTRTAAFDQARLASALSAATGQQVEADRLPFGQFSYSADGRSIHFRSAGKNWMCDLSGYSVSPDTARSADLEERGAGTRGTEELSPDGKKAAFIKDYNLWVRDVATGQETQLTTDGVKDFGYATDNAGWRHSDRPILLWSPDSRKIATSRMTSATSGTCTCGRQM